MIKIMKEACENGKYVSLYTNQNDSSRFTFGKIVYVGKEYIAIGMISPMGNYDGFLAIQAERVLRIDMDDQYSLSMQKLCLHNEMPYVDLSAGENVIESLLIYAMEQKKVVQLELCDSGHDDAAGFVEMIDDSLCKIKQISTYGEEDGYSFVPLHNITKVYCDSEDEQKLLRLYKANKNVE